MAKIRIKGRDYELWMGLWSMEQIEKKYGSMEKAMEIFRTERKISDVRFFFHVLARNGARRAKKPDDVPEDLLDNASLGDLQEISRVLRETLAEGQHTETVGGGEADDEPHDALEAEYLEKNGETGDR